jgi:hypothetical protein
MAGALVAIAVVIAVAFYIILKKKNK